MLKASDNGPSLEGITRYQSQHLSDRVDFEHHWMFRLRKTISVSSPMELSKKITLVCLEKSQCEKLISTLWNLPMGEKSKSSR